MYEGVSARLSDLNIVSLGKYEMRPKKQTIQMSFYSIVKVRSGTVRNDIDV